jgi:hypothetical protein
VGQVSDDVVLVFDHGYTGSTLADVRLEHDWKCQSVSLSEGADATQLFFEIETPAEPFGTPNSAEWWRPQDIGLGLPDKPPPGMADSRGEECEAAEFEREVHHMQGDRG